MAANQPARNSAPSQGTRQNASWSVDAFLEVLWESALESFVRAILVTVFGSIAISMASGIWEEMAPSRPPGFALKLEAESPAPKPGSLWADWIGEHHFVIVFGLIYLLTIWFRLKRGEDAADESGPLTHLGKMGKHVSENWFSLIVGNAFGALISAIIVVWVQQFTFANMIFHWLIESIFSVLQSVVHHFLGARNGNALQAWLGWYDDNQLKFAFWFFYLTAICDDLGIPNFKTLGLRMLRRVRLRLKGVQEPSH